jgi:hypothetical protein
MHFAGPLISGVRFEPALFKLLSATYVDLGSLADASRFPQLDQRVAAVFKARLTPSVTWSAPLELFRITLSD